MQELFYAKCISMVEYHSSKRLWSHKLAIQGASIETRDVAGLTESSKKERAIIEFKEEQCLIDKNVHSKIKQKHKSPMKNIKVAASIISFISPYKTKKTQENKGDRESLLRNHWSILVCYLHCKQFLAFQRKAIERERKGDMLHSKIWRVAHGTHQGGEGKEQHFPLSISLPLPLLCSSCIRLQPKTNNDEGEEAMIFLLGEATTKDSWDEIYRICG